MLESARPVVKFCGMTRAEDAAYAASLGAAYVGVVFAGGVRRLEPAGAAVVLAAAPGVQRVGVFGSVSPGELAAAVDAAGLDVVQLHADPSAADVRRARSAAPGTAVWAALRVDAAGLPAGADALFGEADAVVLDARVAGQLGGTGVALDWASLAGPLERARAGGRLVLAGGLRPETVGEAARLLRPHVVDVSSGVERSPGVKDHARMRAFLEAVRAPAARAAAVPQR